MTVIFRTASFGSTAALENNSLRFASRIRVEFIAPTVTGTEDGVLKPNRVILVTRLAIRLYIILPLLKPVIRVYSTRVIAVDLEDSTLKK